MADWPRFADAATWTSGAVTASLVTSFAKPGCRILIPAPDHLEVIVTDAFPHGTVHEAGTELQSALLADPGLLVLWGNLTPLGRNEFICWVDDAKQAKTRQRRIERTCEELREGKKRPCCWAGCIHRTDKAPGRWQQAVLIDQKGKNRE